MSIKDKFKSLIGIDEEDFYEEEFEMPTDIRPPRLAAMPQQQYVQEQPVREPLRVVEPSRQMNNNRGQGQPMNTQAMMNKVIIREPKDYSDAQNIADCLKENLPVFVNLQRLDRGQGRRVIDFLSGTIYALDGNIERVGSDLFLCTPRTVETDGTITQTKDELSLGEL